MKLVTKTLLAASAVTFTTPAMAVTVVQAGDAGVNAKGARPNTNAAAASFDVAVGSPTIVTFESAQSFFTQTGGKVTNTPVGYNDAVYGHLFAYNTTAQGQYVVEGTGNITFTFANAISSFGAILTGIQNADLSFSFNDGAEQSTRITSYGSGAQFFGLSKFTNPITSITFNNAGDYVGLDDVRFTFAAAPTAVPEPATWAMMLLGFGMVAAAARHRRHNGKISLAQVSDRA